MSTPQTIFTAKILSLFGQHLAAFCLCRIELTRLLRASHNHPMKCTDYLLSKGAISLEQSRVIRKAYQDCSSAIHGKRWTNSECRQRIKQAFEAVDIARQIGGVK